MTMTPYNISYSTNSYGDSVCVNPVFAENLFDKVLQTDVVSARFLAQESLKSSDVHWQAVVEKAFDSLNEKSLESAQFFAHQCKGRENPLCEKIIAKACRALIEKENLDQFLRKTPFGPAFATICMHSHDQRAQTVVEKGLDALLEKRLFADADDDAPKLEGSHLCGLASRKI